jgi:hypothetical protein
MTTQVKIPIEDAIDDFESWFRSCAWERTDKGHFDIGMAVIDTAKKAINQNYQLREAMKEIYAKTRKQNDGEPVRKGWRESAGGVAKHI